MKAFYSDTFVLPLPEQHRFPMAKYRLLRERLVERRDPGRRATCTCRIRSRGTTCGSSTTPAYVDAVANGTLPADAQRRIGFPWSAMMVERSRRSVGATLAAAREVLSAGARRPGSRC